MATENLETNPYGPHSPGQSQAVRSNYYEDGLGTKQSMLVLIIVVGCFAVLWPNLLYPLLFSSTSKSGPGDSGCCDVISELDVDTIKIMSELCRTIIDDSGQMPLDPKEIVSQCRKAVLETCGIDISAALQDRISLGQSVKQILEELRSLNGSLCLKYNFGVSPWKLGVPHRININLDQANSIRQERPPHMHPGMVHPAFRERGRAIPESDGSTARKSKPPPRIVEGRPGPIPGMRAAMAGNQVAASKQSTYGFMGVLMPMYTIGFVIFFSYTIMKLLITKKPDDYVGSSLYPPCDTDEQFHKEVFEANKHYFNRPNKDTSKIGDEELDQLRKRLRETELAMERIVSELAKGPLIATQDEIRANGSLPKEEEQGSVTVMGMETTASSESGKKWSRPDSPVLPHPQPVRPKEPSPPPQQIYLEGALPPQSQILVADSATEAQQDPEDDSPVVLAGKMTLSVISLDSEPGTEGSSGSGKKTESSDEGRRRSSSNISEEFEKINAADLEDQINNIIEEAEQIALAEENRFSLNEDYGLSNQFENDENRCGLRDELEERTVEIPKAPNINEKESEENILEEIKNQFNLEDDLMRVLKEEEPAGKISMPVTDIIKEFLNNEENILQTVDDLVDRDDQENAVGTEEKQEEIGEESLNENKIADTTKEEQLAENLHIIEKTLNSEEPSVKNEKELQTAADLEPSINEEQIVPPQTDVTEEGLPTTELSKSTEQFLKSEASSDTVQLAGQQEIEPIESQDVRKAKVTEERLPTTELPKSTEQFLKSEASSDTVQPAGQQEIGLFESPQKSMVPDEGLFTTKQLESTDELLKSEASRVSDAQPKEQEFGPIESQHVQELEVNVSSEQADESIESHDDAQNRETKPERSKQKSEGETEPEENTMTNKADLLLQGLMVKDTVETVDEGETSSTPETDKKEAATSDQTQTEEETSVDAEESPDILDIEEQEIEDIEYQEDSEDDSDEDELRGDGGTDYQDRDSAERRINGDEGDSSRNGAGNSETAAENEISEDDLENEDDEEIEEIIEYVDNTDEEGEEIIEINGNEHRHLNENGTP